MATTVEPSTFTYVDFDAGHIAALADDLASRIGLDADLPIRIEIDETSALGHTSLESADPVLIRTESGAFENPKKLKAFSDEAAVDVLGRYLLRIADRRSGRFDGAPDDGELTLAQRAAWDVHTMGRLSHMGYPVQRQRWVYLFRNRHGFSDAADAAFQQLWDSPQLTWAELAALSAETEATNPGPLER